MQYRSLFFKASRRARGLFCFILSSLLCLLPVSLSANISATPVVKGLDYPWSMVFLPDGEILVSERGGALRRIQGNRLLAEPVAGMPRSAVSGQGGLMGLALHPDFAKNRWLYFAYLGGEGRRYNTYVARGRYQQGRLTDIQAIFAAEPALSGGRHFGGRLLFDKKGYLYITLGDRGQRELAQQPENHVGSLIRLLDDGRIPTDNPFVGQAGKQDAIYSYGHRNIQGIALNPANQQLFTHEHGPRGGDEINIIQRGANYGWPVITYGKEYFGGRVGDGATQKAGMQQPTYYWTPSIAPSGMAFYNGERYPGWQGSLLVGSLKFSLLVRMQQKAGQWVESERLLQQQIGRIRDVQQGPDGFIYLLTDESRGALYRLDWQGR